ncbi:8-amino-7-oxononanoate synthase [Chryseobacterium defluvii]|uniref:8-amino-7-oxononanoate synthase n=1 Tax=Chryseobacterium defluvii TaxID=160396 RepID=A0A840KBW3_9FLAO|nr:aminotransferase class I/II-fold pyridoxal phosphate-dependent enzyme [Chryseobacterium defluvii]MBB4805497.1 8-amino-7-oxononanoate synthase [Chryseobacterium defluvii]
MNQGHHHLREALEKRRIEGTLRSLRPRSEGIDFYSNDYLGLARNAELQHLLLKQINDQPHLLSGSTGSRLISGNSSEVIAVEESIAGHHQYPSALLFPSGYNANLALLSTLPARHDTIITDELVHRSIHDGCKLSNARKLKFRHNDLKSLEDKLRKQDGHCYIAIESLYSMDGDLAPLREIAEIAEKYSASLLVDEAHALGVFGNGLVAEYQLQEKVLTTVVTYGKAFGAHGAAILCNELIKAYLINFASPFIYSTSSQDLQWRAIKTSYDYLKNNDLSSRLMENIRIFRKQGLPTPSAENSPVQAIIIPDHHRLKELQNTLFEEGFLTYAVYSPAVKAGTERLRICLHSFNTEEEITKLTQIIQHYT